MSIADRSPDWFPLSIEQRNTVTPRKLRQWWYTFHVDLPDPIDVAALDHAIATVMDRHEPLRLRLRSVGGSYEQFVAATARPVLHVDQVVRGQLSEHWSRLDVLQSGPFRATLARYGGGANRLLVSVHHLGWDAWSYYVWRRELLAAYASRIAGTADELPPLPMTFSDHVRRQVAAGDRLTGDQEAYWSSVFAGSTPFAGIDESRSGLPASGLEPGTSRWSFRESEPVSEEAMGKLQAAAAAARVTGATVLLGFTVLSLCAAYNADDILFFLVHHGRDRRELHDMIGMFNRSVVVRARIRPESTLSTFLSELSANVRDAIRQSQAPFTTDRLLDLLERPPLTGHERLTHISVNLPYGRRPAAGESRRSDGMSTRLGELTTRSWTPRPSQLWIASRTDPEWKWTAEYDRLSFADDSVTNVLTRMASLTGGITVSALGRSVRELLTSSQSGSAIQVGAG